MPRYIGLRQGEKLFEELLLDEEDNTAARQEKIYVANPAKYDLAEFLQIMGVLRMWAETITKKKSASPAGSDQDLDTPVPLVVAVSEQVGKWIADLSRSLNKPS